MSIVGLFCAGLDAPVLFAAASPPGVVVLHTDSIHVVFYVLTKGSIELSKTFQKK